MEKTSLAVHFAVLNLVLSQIGVKNELRMLKIGDNYKKNVCERRIFMGRTVVLHVGWPSSCFVQIK